MVSKNQWEIFHRIREICNQQQRMNGRREFYGNAHGSYLHRSPLCKIILIYISLIWHLVNCTPSQPSFAVYFSDSWNHIYVESIKFYKFDSCSIKLPPTYPLLLIRAPGNLYKLKSNRKSKSIIKWWPSSWAYFKHFETVNGHQKPRHPLFWQFQDLICAFCTVFVTAVVGGVRLTRLTKGCQVKSGQHTVLCSTSSSSSSSSSWW